MLYYDNEIFNVAYKAIVNAKSTKGFEETSYNMISGNDFRNLRTTSRQRGRELDVRQESVSEDGCRHRKRTENNGDKPMGRDDEACSGQREKPELTPTADVSKALRGMIWMSLD